MKPQPSYSNDDGTFVLASFVAPGTQLPLIDTVADTGKYVGAILADPAAFEGKVVSAATGLYSFEEMARVLSRASGKTVAYQQVPREVFRGFLPEAMAGEICDMFSWIEEFGYYGPGTAEKVKETAALARGRLTTLEEYFEKNPLEL